MARGWNWMVCNVPTHTILWWFCDSKTASTAMVPVPYRSSLLCYTVGGIPTVRTVRAQCELKLPFAAPPQAAAERRPAFSNIWAPEFWHQPETQLRANLCLPNHLQAKTQPRAGRTCSRQRPVKAEQGTLLCWSMWVPHVPSAAFSQRQLLFHGALKLHWPCRCYRLPVKGQQHSQLALTAGKVYGQALKGERRYKGNSLKIYWSKEIKPQDEKQKEKRNLSESKSMAQARNNPQWQQWNIDCSIKAAEKKVCISHNECKDLESSIFS